MGFQVLGRFLCSYNLLDGTIQCISHSSRVYESESDEETEEVEATEGGKGNQENREGDGAKGSKAGKEDEE